MSRRKPKRFFTKADYEKGLCDENGLAKKSGIEEVVEEVIEEVQEVEEEEKESE